MRSSVKEDTPISIGNGLLRCGNTTYESDLIKLAHPENLERIELPINYSALDVLRLNEKYSKKALAHNNLLAIVEKLKSNS